MTTQDYLNSINAAIAQIEGGAQEYQIGSRKVVKADLKTLYDERKSIEAQLQNEQYTGVFGKTSVAKFAGR